jgi:hypothetical protein
MPAPPAESALTCLSDEDRAFVECAAGINLKLECLKIAFGAKEKATAITAMQAAVAALTAAATSK